MKNKLWVVLALAVVAVGAYSIFHRTDDVGGVVDEKVVKIGMSQIAPHVVLDSVRAEIVKTLADEGYVEGKNLVLDYQNAQGDMNVNQAIAQTFARSDYDLFVAITTPSSQALAHAVTDRPIIFAAVSDPLKAELVTDLQHPGGNITGTSDITLYRQPLEFLKQIKPGIRAIGVVYNPSEVASNSGLEQTRTYAAELGIEVITATANTTNDVLPAARSLVDRVDAFYIIPDNTVISGQDALIKIAIENKKPLIAYEESGVEKGALATFSTNYEELGKQTAQMVVDVLKGKNPGDMPVHGVTEASLFLNTTTAEQIGVTFSDEQLKEAKHIYR